MFEFDTDLCLPSCDNPGTLLSFSDIKLVLLSPWGVQISAVEVSPRLFCLGNWWEGSKDTWDEAQLRGQSGKAFLLMVGGMPSFCCQNPQGWQLGRQPPPVQTVTETPPEDIWSSALWTRFPCDFRACYLKPLFLTTTVKCIQTPFLARLQEKVLLDDSMCMASSS